jgi:hypothetical protein
MDEHRHNAFLPVLLLSISLLTVFVWQLVGSFQQRSMLQNSIQRQDELVSQAGAVQKSLERLLTDLLELAKTNEQARAVVEKYKIARQTPPQTPQE